MRQHNFRFKMRISKYFVLPFQTLGCFASIVYILGMLFALRDFRASHNAAQQSSGTTSAGPVHETPEAPPTSLYDPKY